jgi:hypothetical protein
LRTDEPRGKTERRTTLDLCPATIKFSSGPAKASEIEDPFEAAFFVMVQLPYLQAFEDVNKRGSRLAANIPVIRQNFCPLSFVDLEAADYVNAPYRFQRSKRGRLMRLVRPKSLRKLRETIKPKTRRTNGKSMEAIAAKLNLTLKGWYGYFKHVKSSQLGDIDGWIRMRLRSILRKRHGLKDRGRGRDHQRWPNRYFTELGLFCLLDAKVTETASLRQGANH